MEIHREDWYSPEEAAQVLSQNSGKVIGRAYVRTLARYSKVRKLPLTSRANLYSKKDIDEYIVENRGVKSGRAKKKGVLEKRG